LSPSKIKKQGATKEHEKVEKVANYYPIGLTSFYAPSSALYANIFPTFQQKVLVVQKNKENRQDF
jgi:hypothetical protein